MNVDKMWKNRKKLVENLWISGGKGRKVWKSYPQNVENLWKSAPMWTFLMWKSVLDDIRLTKKEP